MKPLEIERREINEKEEVVEWHATVHDRGCLRTALVTVIKESLAEIILDESGCCSGAGIKINPECLSKKDKDYYNSIIEKRGYKNN